MRDENTRNTIIFFVCAAIMLMAYQFFVADPQAKRLQAWLEDQDVSYVMAVRCSDTLTTPAGKQRADALIAAVPAAARQDNDQVGTKASYISPSLA